MNIGTVVGFGNSSSNSKPQYIPIEMFAISIFQTIHIKVVSYVPCFVPIKFFRSKVLTESYFSSNFAELD